MKTPKFLETAHFVSLGSFRFALGVFVLAILLFSPLAFLLAFNGTNLLDYGGYFSSWKLFQLPPSPVQKIIRVDGNKVIWVKTKTGEIYSKSFYRGKNPPWKKEKVANFAPTNIYSEHFGSCEVDNTYSFEGSFPKPPEEVSQCSRLEEWTGNSDFIWYFALSENGKLWIYQYWEDELVTFCILCPTTIGIMVIILAILRFGLRRLKLRLENAQRV